MYNVRCHLSIYFFKVPDKINNKKNIAFKRYVMKNFNQSIIDISKSNKNSLNILLEFGKYAFLE